MSPGEKKASMLVTRYVDGAAVGMLFSAPHVLDLAYVDREGKSPRPVRIDFQAGTVSADGSVVALGTGALNNSHAVAGIAAIATNAGADVYAIASASHDTDISAAIAAGRLLQHFTRMGKRPQLQVRLSDDGSTLFTSATDVLNRCNIATGKVQKLRCFDRVTHMAASPRFIAAQNKEGVLTIFDAASNQRCLTLRIAHDGWLAFDDKCRFDRSPGFTRGIELSWTDARSQAFVPELGLGTLPLNQFPLVDVDVDAPPSHVPGLLQLPHLR
jgi:hypothetical protein